MGYNASNYTEQGGGVSVYTGGRIGRIIIASTAQTLTRAESGAVIISTAADLVHVLPATAAGLRYTFLITTAALSVGTGLSISPVAADFITGNGLTATDDKDLINSGASDRAGDCVTIVADGVDGWYIESVVGTWAKEG